MAPDDRPFARYFTLTHLYNAAVVGGASDHYSLSQLPVYRDGLSKLVNSLSWAPAVKRPRPVDPLSLILHIDLRDYHWDAQQWDRIAAAYPYAVRRHTAAERAIARMSNCGQGYLRADWFAAVASRPPYYHQLLKLPRTERGLERKLGIDPNRNREQGRAIRAGIGDSDVSFNNRLLERHPIDRRQAGYAGAYWKSYDFRGGVGRRSIFAHPLGPSADGLVPDGGEVIFSLPNGLNGYLLIDDKGNRIDQAPTDIVRDTDGRLPAVVTGVSCIACHDKGMNALKKRKVDQVRGHVSQVRGQAKGFSAEEAEQVFELYPLPEDFAALQLEDSRRFQQTVERTLSTAPLSPDPTWELVRRYTSALSMSLAAAEVGLPPEKFATLLAESPAVARAVGLLARGGWVSRAVFEEAFPLLVRQWGLAEIPDRELPRTGVSASSRDDLPLSGAPQIPAPQAGKGWLAGWSIFPLAAVLGVLIWIIWRRLHVNSGVGRSRRQASGRPGRISAKSLVILVLTSSFVLAGWRYWRSVQRSPAEPRNTGPVVQGNALPGPSLPRESNPALARTHLLQGQAHLDKNEYELAAEEYGRAIHADPSCWAAYEGRGVAFFAAGDLRRSKDGFTGALERNPQALHSARQRGVVYRLMGEIDLALADLQQAIRLDPSDAPAYCERGHVYREKGRLCQALADCNRALELAPGMAEAHYCRALVHAEEGRHDRALADFTAAARLAPQNIHYHLGRAEANHRLGRHVDADADEERALGVPPRTAHDYANRGCVFLVRKEYNPAADAFTQAIRYQQRFGWAFAGRAHAYAGMRMWDKAVANSTEAIRLLPGEGVLYLNRGMSYRQKGDPAAADADFAQAVGIQTQRIHADPGSPAAWERRAAAHHARGEPDRALTDYEQALRLDGRFVRALLGRGQVHFQRGDQARALADFNAALAVDPACAPAIRGRAAAYQQKGSSGLALRDLDEAIRLDPSSAAALIERGAIRLVNGDVAGALGDLDRALKPDPELGTGRYYRGVAYARIGEFSRAAGEFSEAIRLDPKSSVAYQGRAGTHQARGHYQLALADLEEAIRLDPRSANAWAGRGMTYLSLGAYERALADFDRALGIDKACSVAFLGRGTARVAMADRAPLWRKGKRAPIDLSPWLDRLLAFGSAVADFTQAIRFDPKDARAYLGCVRALSRLAVIGLVSSPSKSGRPR